MRADVCDLPAGDGRLPLHGFVLAGGQSLRMGRDKALLQLGGRTLVEIALDRLRSFCAEVSVLGNRGDLADFAPVIPETRLGAGPGAGMEAGLAAAMQIWALFTPVDVPLVPAALLRGWSQAVLTRAERGCEASFLRVGEDRQPAFALVRTRGLGALAAALEAGERRVAGLLGAVSTAAGGELWIAEASLFAGDMGAAEVAGWFRNLNTPPEFLAVKNSFQG